MWFVVGIGAFTILLAVEAWAISSGRLRKWPARYEATDAPLNLRHGFAVLWAGAISCALVTVTFVFIAGNRPPAAPARAGRPLRFSPPPTASPRPRPCSCWSSRPDTWGGGGRGDRRNG